MLIYANILNYFTRLTPFQSIYYNGKAPGAEFQYSDRCGR